MMSSSWFPPSEIGNSNFSIFSVLSAVLEVDSSVVLTVTLTSSGMWTTVSSADSESGSVKSCSSISSSRSSTWSVSC